MPFRGVLVAFNHGIRSWGDDAIPDEGYARHVLGSFYKNDWTYRVGAMVKSSSRNPGRRGGDTFNVTLYDFRRAPDDCRKFAWMPCGFRWRDVGRTGVSLPQAVYVMIPDATLDAWWWNLVDYPRFTLLDFGNDPDLREAQIIAGDFFVETLTDRNWWGGRKFLNETQLRAYRSTMNCILDKRQRDVTDDFLMSGPTLAGVYDFLNLWTQDPCHELTRDDRVPSFQAVVTADCCCPKINLQAPETSRTAALFPEGDRTAAGCKSALTHIIRMQVWEETLAGNVLYDGPAEVLRCGDRTAAFETASARRKRLARCFILETEVPGAVDLDVKYALVWIVDAHDLTVFDDIGPYVTMDNFSLAANFNRGKIHIVRSKAADFSSMVVDPSVDHSGKKHVIVLGGTHQHAFAFASLARNVKEEIPRTLQELLYPLPALGDRRGNPFALLRPDELATAFAEYGLTVPQQTAARDLVAASRRNAVLGFSSPAGGGKTLVTCLLIYLAYQSLACTSAQGVIRKTLVCTPKGMHLEELRMVLNRFFEESEIMILGCPRARQSTRASDDVETEHDRFLRTHADDKIRRTDKDHTLRMARASLDEAKKRAGFVGPSTAELLRDLLLAHAVHYKALWKVYLPELKGARDSVFGGVKVLLATTDCAAKVCGNVDKTGWLLGKEPLLLTVLDEAHAIQLFTALAVAAFSGTVIALYDPYQAMKFLGHRARVSLRGNTLDYREREELIRVPAFWKWLHRTVVLTDSLVYIPEIMRFGSGPLRLVRTAEAARGKEYEGIPGPETWYVHPNAPNTIVWPVIFPQLTWDCVSQGDLRYARAEEFFCTVALIALLATLSFQGRVPSIRVLCIHSAQRSALAVFLKHVFPWRDLHELLRGPGTTDLYLPVPEISSPESAAGCTADIVIYCAVYQRHVYARDLGGLFLDSGRRMEGLTRARNHLFILYEEVDKPTHLVAKLATQVTAWERVLASLKEDLGLESPQRPAFHVPRTRAGPHIWDSWVDGHHSLHNWLQELVGRLGPVGVVSSTVSWTRVMQYLNYAYHTGVDWAGVQSAVREEDTHSRVDDVFASENFVERIRASRDVPRPNRTARTLGTTPEVFPLWTEPYGQPDPVATGLWPRGHWARLMIPAIQTTLLDQGCVKVSIPVLRDERFNPLSFAGMEDMAGQIVEMMACFLMWYHPTWTLTRAQKLHKLDRPHEDFEMYFVKRCGSERVEHTLRVGGRQVFYIYNAMGVEGQDDEVSSLLAYCETPEFGPFVAAALFAALHLARTDIIMEPGMVRFYDMAPQAEIDAFCGAFQPYTFRNPDALSGLTAAAAARASARDVRIETPVASSVAVPPPMSQTGGSSASTDTPRGSRKRSTEGEPLRSPKIARGHPGPS